MGKPKGRRTNTERRQSNLRAGCRPRWEIGADALRYFFMHANHLDMLNVLGSMHEGCAVLLVGM